MIDWHSLLRHRTRAIEDGSTRSRGPTERRSRRSSPTALRTLTGGGALALDGEPGWWERPERLLSRKALLADARCRASRRRPPVRRDQAYA